MYRRERISEGVHAAALAPAASPIANDRSIKAPPPARGAEGGSDTPLVIGETGHGIRETLELKLTEVATLPIPFTVLRNQHEVFRREMELRRRRLIPLTQAGTTYSAA